MSLTDYEFNSERQQRLKTYCLHRLEQLRAQVPLLKFWGAENALNGYFRGLRLVCEEIDHPVNDPETKSRNCHWLLLSNDCWLFMDDANAIMSGRQPFLPDDIYKIPAYKAEIRRKEEEEQARIKKIADDIAWDAMQKRMAAQEAESQKHKREQLAQELGIDVEALEKLKEGQKRVGAIQS